MWHRVPCSIDDVFLMTLVMLLVVELLGGAREWSKVLKSRRSRLMKAALSVMES